MAIELTEHADAKLLEVKASGKLSKGDYEHFERAVVMNVKIENRKGPTN